MNVRAASPTERASVLVCRGCCCGTAKHATVDHAGQLDRLRRAVAAAPAATLWTVDCLGPCERSNVVVVRTGPRRHWFGELLDDADVDVLAGWVSNGAPGDVPPSLARRLFDPGPAGSGAGTGAVQPLAPQDGGLYGWLAETAGAPGLWAIGVPGAFALFDPAGAEPDCDAATATVTLTAAGAAMGLIAAEEARAFAVHRADTTGTPGTPGATPFAYLLAVPEGSAQQREDFHGAGPDRAAIGGPPAGDTAGLLFDLGVGRGRVSVAVRATAGGAIERLAALNGSHWRDSIDAVAAELAAGTVHGVARSPLGRIEIGPTGRAAPTDASAGAGTAGPSGPSGASTMVLSAGEIDLGLGLLANLAPPAGYELAAVFFPAPRA